MRIVLIGAGIEENLALAYLVPPLRGAGHEVRIAAFDSPGDRDRVVAEVARDRPAVVGMSVAFQHRLPDFRDLARAIREAGCDAAIVWGGHIPTARAGHLLREVPEIDVVVRHDGEATLAELVSALADHPLPPPADPRAAREVAGPLLARLCGVDGLAFRLPGGREGATPPRAAERDLDAIAAPARDDPPARHAGLAFVPILGSRGCWGSCTYCSIQTYHRGRRGPRVRLRDPDAVAAEMADLYHGRAARVFCFHDENFFLPRPTATRRRLAALREGLDRRGVGRIGIVAKCRPDEVDADVLRDAMRIGLVRAYVGIENGSRNGLDHLGRRTTVEQCRRALDLFREAGLYACFNVLLFEPDTTIEDVAGNVEFLSGTLDFPWNFCRAEVYPGSFLERDLARRGRLRGGLEGMSYAIADGRAELLFRICAVAFGGRNFGPQGVANAASGMGYLAALLRRFHDGREARAFEAESCRLVRALGGDTLDRISEAHGFAAAGPHPDDDVRAFTAGLAMRVAVADATFWPAIEGLRAAMDRFGADRVRAEQVASRRVGLGGAAAAVIAAGIATQGCEEGGGGKAPTHYDAPVPHDVAPDPQPEEIMVADPLPPDVWEVKDTPPEIHIDPPPPDVSDPLPPDVTENPGGDVQPDVTVVDPPPPDVMADPPPPDVMVDPPPPDTAPDATDPDPDAASDSGTMLPLDAPVMDPLPPDMGMRSPSASLPLDRAFRVRLDAASAGAGEVRLVASPTDPGARLRWEAVGGALEACGSRATFRPDGSGPAVVVVFAEGDGGRLDVARHVV